MTFVFLFALFVIGILCWLYYNRKVWVEHKKMACYWSGEKWEYVNAKGVPIGRAHTGAVPVPLEKCQAACKGIKNCTGIEFAPNKYCSLWYNKSCDTSTPSWHKATNEDTWTYYPAKSFKP